MEKNENSVAVSGPQAKIACTGTKVILYAFLAVAGLKIVVSLIQMLGVGIGAFPVSAELVKDEWRLYTNFPFHTNDIYNAFPAEWAGKVTAIENPEYCFLVFTGLSLVSVAIPVFVILMMARKLLAQIKPGCSPFTKKSASAVRTIGIIIICMAIFSTQILQIGMAGFVFHRVYFENPYKLNYILIGLVILVIGKVFRYGCELQEESDLTV